MTITTDTKPAWERYALIALHALIIWPIQYMIAAPITTLAAWTWGFIKAATKIGVVAIVLLFIPIIGWAILAVWLIMRSNDKTQERRHQETMTAMGHPLEEDEATPLWKSIWTPWKVGL